VTGLNRTEAADAAALARSGAVVVLLPGCAHFGLHSFFPPARLLIDAGVAVALATGFRAVLPSTLSMQAVISLACTHMNMTAEEAISGGTINAAHAIRRAAACGSLEFGKDADLIVVSSSDYRDIPYRMGVNMVELVMRAGKAVYHEGSVS
jgi:imidazolonepropionase